MLFYYIISNRIENEYHNLFSVAQLYLQLVKKLIDLREKMIVEKIGYFQNMVALLKFKKCGL